MISTKEVTFLTTTLEREKLLMKKYSYYSTITNNQDIKNLCQTIVDAHKYHFDTLIKYLQKEEDG